MKRIFLALVLAVLVLSPVAALGDVYETFDNYVPGTTSPASLTSIGNPWTCSVDGNTTCGALTGYGPCFSPSTGVTYVGNSASGTYSPPNVYTLYVSSGAACSASGHSAFTGTHYVQLSAQLNVTAGGVTLSFFRQATVSTVDLNATVFLCGVRVFTSLFNAEPSTFTKLSESASGAIGTICPLVFRVYPTHGTGPATGKWQFDNVAVHNANLINANANLFMVSNSGTQGLVPGGIPQWYNITNYAGSYVELDTPNAAPLTYGNISAPDIHVNYGTATILKMWVIPSSYYVQIIPNDAGSNTVWLFPPSIVDTFTVSVQDLSNLFPPGSEIQVAQGTRLLSSGYTDAQNTYPLWIVPGGYSLTITNGPNVYSTTINFPSVSGTTIPVQILKYKQSGNCGQVCQINYGAGFAAGGTNIVVSYTDSTGTSTSVIDQVWVNTPLGPSEFYTNTWSPGPYSSITDTVSCHNDSCNSTLAGSIYVVLIFVNQYGSNTEHIPVGGGSTFLNIPDLPQGILAWNVVFPTSPSPLNFAAYLIVILSASSMGALASKFGVVVVAGEAAVLGAAGWLALAGGGGMFLILLAVLSFIGFLEAGR